MTHKERELFNKMEEYITFLENDISKNTPYLTIHGIYPSTGDIKRGECFRSEISQLKSEVAEQLPLSGTITIHPENNTNTITPKLRCSNCGKLIDNCDASCYHKEEQSQRMSAEEKNRKLKDILCNHTQSINENNGKIWIGIPDYQFNNVVNLILQAMHDFASQGQDLKDIISSLRIDPLQNDGWSFDYKFLESIARKSEYHDENVSMEQINTVLLILCGA